MSIFGDNEPKIVTLSDVTINLDKTLIVKDEPDYRRIRQEDVVSSAGIIYNNTRGMHWLFWVTIHLFKYSTDHGDKFDALYDTLNKNVTLHRHRDKDSFKDSNGNVVPFYFAEIVPFYFDSPNYRDVLLLKFESTAFVDLQSTTFTTLIAEDETPITTEDGQGIIVA